ncbi:MAG: two component transcriptional regulator, winged helix family [Acidimicrobiales bacterium]|jgi:two-component system OmpR family response regulator|nr:two component transcriptional regulator, winged helix family [Acidimicrobiales bacterium]
MQVQVLAVEDDPDVRDLLVAVLEREGWAVHATGPADDVQRVADEMRPDVVILDVRDGSDDSAGLNVARRLRAGSDVPIVFCSALGTVADRISGFESGGDDYIVKPFSHDELIARLRAVLRRSGRGASPVIRVGDLVVDDRAHVVSYCRHVLDVTRLEFGVLSLLAGHPGRVVSKVELLDRLWGHGACDVNLVERHMSGLRAKLELVGPRIVHTVRGVGYVLRTT